MRRIARVAGLCLGLAGVGLAGSAAWIPAKAALAQILLERAWARTLAGEAAAKPWPWADIAPIARLSAPRQGAAAVVLDGAHGEALAFGPGWIAATARPGDPGLAALSGHNDTHFAFLAEVRPGDPLALQTSDGSTTRYRVSEAYVVDARRVRLPPAGATRDEGEAPFPRLALVTCFPFDGGTGATQRLVILAEPIAEPSVRAL